MIDIELTPEEKALIAAGRGGVDPTQQERTRVCGAIEAKLATGVTLGLTWTAPALASAAKIGAGVAVVAALTMGGIHLGRTGQAQAPSPPARPAAAAPGPTTEPARATTPAPALVPEPPPEVDRAREIRPRREARAAVPVVPGTLGEETALLAQAGDAVSRHDPAQAARLLREYDRRFRGGALAEERAVTGILTLCAAGRVETARSEAARFATRWPRSPLRARVDASCAGHAPR